MPVQWPTSPLPDFSQGDMASLAIGWWNQALWGYFDDLIYALILASIALKTRSMSAITVAAGIIAGLTGSGFYLLIAGLGLAGLLWNLWQRSAE
ncbi:MAG TPA: hypothetical protein EYP33_02380 [Pyrodictium sp.]|nr:hypothetical protein [Pyrodictium sp.]